MKTRRLVSIVVAAFLGACGGGTSGDGTGGTAGIISGGAGGQAGLGQGGAAVDAGAGAGGNVGTAGGSGAGGAATTTIAESEPNNGPSLAGTQDLGTFSATRIVKVTGTLSSGGNDGVNYSGDLDAFRFVVAQAGGTIGINIQWTGTADVDVILYDGNLQPVDADVTTTTPIAKSGSIPAGTYVLMLASKDAAAAWTMTLTYTLPITGTGGTCVSPLVPSTAGTGCVIQLIEPANGVQLTGPTYFGFKMIGCETPAKLRIYGNPPTLSNSYYWEFNRGSLTLQEWFTTGRAIQQSDVAGLASDNGVYHWQVESWYGAGSEARTFTFAPNTCK